MAFLDKHAILERSPTLLLTFSLLVVTVGGIVEIAPLFWLENTIEDVEGVRPYSPLELTGRDIYIREGCYVCHSQMIRPIRTLRALLAGGGIAIRSPVPVGVKAHRPGRSARRWTLFRRMARGSPERSAVRCT